MAAVRDRADAEPAAQSVLLRQIAAQRARRAADRADPAAAAEPPPPPPVPLPRTPERAVASAIARAAERVHGLPLFFDRITTGHAVVAELGELLPEHALIAIVEGPGDTLGMVAVCPGLLTSLIEMQALGRISARPPVPRRPTRTDAAICTDFLDACLAEIGAELAAQPDFAGVAGYRYVSFLDDPRPLELMLEDVTYRLITVSLRAGAAGQRDGGMVFLMPAAPACSAAIPPAIPGPAPVGAADVSGSPVPGVLAAQMDSLPIELIGILCRRRISLGELQALAPGDTIALPPGALSGATLETATGQTLLRGRLGELAGRHALRIAAGQTGAGREETGREGTAPGEPAFATGAGPGIEAASDLAADPHPMAGFGDLDPFRAVPADDAAGLPLTGFGGPDDSAPAEQLGWDADDLPALGTMPMTMQIG